jgi:hypothetical protein
LAGYGHAAGLGTSVPSDSLGSDFAVDQSVPVLAMADAIRRGFSKITEEKYNIFISPIDDRTLPLTAENRHLQVSV